MKGRIHSIESMGLVDGPGIRTVVFLQGCRLRCKYCHNPDTWAIRSGRARLMEPEELIRRLVRFRPYYGREGGVTFSGGEPLLQKDFLLQALPLCKAAGINVCLDTAGCGEGGYEEILRFTDLVLLDVKHFTPEGFQMITGGEPDESVRFLKTAQRLGTPLWIRHVVVPGLTDGDGHMERLRRFVRQIKNVRRVELLPYHTLGAPKYYTMGIPYPLKGVPPMDPDKTAAWQRIFEQDLKEKNQSQKD